MQKLVQSFLLGLGLLVASSQAASADVTFCNKTGTFLNVSIAAHVTVPYDTIEARGWQPMENGDCFVALTGDYTGEKLYYFAFNENGEWQEDRDFSPVCIPTDGNAFIRRGSASQLQPPCSSGEAAKHFYSAAITAKTFKYTIYSK
ncbi:MAG: DUF1036 domain-containing protein [Micropepsaceae bacterium]